MSDCGKATIAFIVWGVKETSLALATRNKRNKANEICGNLIQSIKEGLVWKYQT